MAEEPACWAARWRIDRITNLNPYASIFYIAAFVLWSRSYHRMLLEIWPMFGKGTHLPRVFARGVSSIIVSASRISVSAPGFAVLIVGIALLVNPRTMLAQRGGGGGGGGGGGVGHNGMPIICVHDCPDRRKELNTDDDLKNFHRSIAMQATAEQRAAFAKVSQYTQAASDRLRDFHESLPKVSASLSPADHALADRGTALDQAIERARAGNQNFLGSFSDAQKSGLKEITNKLAKVDSELDKQIKTLDQIVQAPKPDSAQIDTSAANLDKALASFQSEQLALGAEMSIVFPADGQNVVFSLPPVTNSINISGQPVSIPASGAVVSRASAENGHNLFSLKLVADLSDLQQNITGILRTELTRNPRCGQRIEVQQARLTPLEPAGLVVANLHFERWVCQPGQSPMEVADSNATLEVKLTPSVVPTTGLALASEIAGVQAGFFGLALASEITRVQAEGFLRDSLRSGDLGVTLRQQIAASILSVLAKGADFRTTLPPVANEYATLQKVQFQDAGADQLNFILDGQLQLSDEQTKQFAAQLKQQLSAQGTTPP